MKHRMITAEVFARLPDVHRKRGQKSPRIAVRTLDGTITLEASVPLERLSPAYADAALTLGLSAVIEDRDGALSYWALRHPAGKPDFHHADAFALALNSRHSGAGRYPLPPAGGKVG